MTWTEAHQITFIMFVAASNLCTMVVIIIYWRCRLWIFCCEAGKIRGRKLLFMKTGSFLVPHSDISFWLTSIQIERFIISCEAMTWNLIQLNALNRIKNWSEYFYDSHRLVPFVWFIWRQMIHLKIIERVLLSCYNVHKYSFITESLRIYCTLIHWQ